jgi:filamentous hemagglutinin family protein
MKTLSGLQGYWKLSVVRFLVLGGRTSLTGCFAISFAGALWAIAASGNYAWGQVTSDNTLGAESSLVTSPIPGTFQIDGGATRGTNLFHSFSLFSVPSNGIAYFNNALNIQNIMTRVTGGSVSNIDGLLRANGTANLFLLNPNGIIFGPNASLNIGGSLMATTANSLMFADGSVFSTNPAQSPPLLTINVPIGLQLGSNQSGAITNAANLSVNPKQNLSLIGSSIVNTGQLTALGGQVTVAAVFGQGMASLGQAGKLLSLDYQPTAVSSNQSDRGTAIITGAIDASNSAAGQTGGIVQILGDRVGLLANSRVNVSGDAGGGKVLVGSDYQGMGALPQAIATYVSPQATIQADALTTGDGGQIIVWANESTRAYGSLSARGGLQAGNGGLIETSSRNFLDVAGIRVNATATNGLGGTWLLDPRNITLSSSGTSINGSFSGGNPNIFTPSGDNAVVNIPDIEAQLNAGTNVVITTGGTGIQEGNITGDSFSLNKTTTSPATLTLQAANDITLKNFYINNNPNTRPLGVVLQADSDGSGRGNVSLSNGQIQTRGGAFTATAAGSVSLEKVEIRSENTRAIAAEPITIVADALNLQGEINNNPRSRINSNTTDKNGNAAPIIINVNSLSVRNGSIRSQTSGNGNGGFVMVTADSVGLLGDSGISSDTSGNGNAGFVTVTANSVALLRKSGINSDTSGNGNAGVVTVKAGSLLVENESGVGSTAKGGGDAGSINIVADSIRLNNKSGISSSTTGDGDAGAITIQTGSFLIENNSGLGSDARGVMYKGNAGAITVTADSIVIKSNSGMGSHTYGEGNAGTITIKTGSFVMENSGLGSDAKKGSQGNAGRIDITADSVSFQNSGVSSETGGSGNAGEITLKANSVELRNNSNITTSTLQNSTGNGGRIEVTANSVLFENDVRDVNSGLGSVTRGKGNAGQIILQADSVVMRNRGGIGISTESEGNAGQLTLTANSLVMENTGIGSNTSGPGKAGQININVGTASLNNSSITTNTSGRGNGGEITVAANSALLRNNSSISSTTRSSGTGGNIIVQIDGALTVRDRSRLSVSSNLTSTNNSLGKAGNIDVQARSILLDNQGEIKGEATSVDGGNIELNVKDLLLLRRNSPISTSAGTAQAGGNGGNITINAPFIVAVPSENSDITANAFTGRGGNINIATQGIYGLQFRPRLTSLSDITASSEFGVNGTVQINTPDVDPSRGLVNLPFEPVNVEVTQGCQAAGEQASVAFFNTGRGGLAPNPYEPITSSKLWEDGSPPTQRITSSASVDSASASPATPPHKIVEAQGWLINEKGQVVLVAEMPATHSQGRCRLR